MKIDLSAISYVGDGLNRPGSVIATAKGELFCLRSLITFAASISWASRREICKVCPQLPEQRHCAGPAHSPDDRPYIERFFGTVASSLSSRLPGYTGTIAHDIRRALADPKGSLDKLEGLLEAALAHYNASPHNGPNGRTPLEAVEHSVRGRGAMLNWLPETKPRTLCLMHTPHTATVRGYLDQGQRPHVNFQFVRYTNTFVTTLLRSTATEGATRRWLNKPWPDGASNRRTALPRGRSDGSGWPGPWTCA